MERNKETNDGKMCSCEMCQGYGRYGYHRFFWLRLILGLVIILMVFFLGVKIGEFKGYFEGNFGYNNYSSYPVNRGYRPGPIVYPMSTTPSTNSNTVTQ